MKILFEKANTFSVRKVLGISVVFVLVACKFLACYSSYVDCFSYCALWILNALINQSLSFSVPWPKMLVQPLVKPKSSQLLVLTKFLALGRCSQDYIVRVKMTWDVQTIVHHRKTWALRSHSSLHI